MNVFSVSALKDELMYVNKEAALTVIYEAKTANQ